MNWHTLKNSNLFLTAIFTLSVAVVFFIGAITYKHVIILRTISTQLETCVKIHLELDNVFLIVKDAETAQRAYIISEDKKYLQPFIKSDKAIKTSLDVLHSLTHKNKSYKFDLQLVENIINKRQDLLQKSITLIDKGEYDYDTLTKNLEEGNLVMNVLETKINKMIAGENKKLQRSNITYADMMSDTPLIIYSTLLITLVFISLAFIKVNQNLVHLKKSNSKLLLSIDANSLSEVVGSFGNWQLDLQSGKHTYSDNLYRLLGVEPQSFKATQEEFSKFIHPDDQQYVAEQTKDLHTLGELSTIVFRIIRKDKEIRYFRVRSETAQNFLERKTVIATTTDVTEEILFRKLIEDRNKELETRNNELSAFNYIAGHDLQEPLRKIELFVSLLHEKELATLTESGKIYMEKIKSSTNRMRILIEDLLKFSSTSKSEKIFDKANLNDLFENSKIALMQSIEDTGTIIVCENLPTLRVIAFQIQQLFTNLIENSIKYKKPDQSAHIQIYSQLIVANSDERLPNTDQKFYNIRFQDDGIGFEQEYADKIFVLFSRLHNKDDFEGTGIGLAICKKIVDNHDGFIFAESSLNNGATFSIFLPA